MAKKGKPKSQLLGQFSKFCTFFFYMGLHYVNFTFAFDTTLIRLEMTEIWPKYVAQAFLPNPPESSAQDPTWIGLKGVFVFFRVV